MSVKSILKKSAIVAATIASTISAANAKVQYNIGLGYGLGLFEFNGGRENSALQGNTTITQLGLDPLSQIIAIGFAGGNASPTMRTTYKYVDQQPSKQLYLEAGLQNSFDSLNLLDRTLFAGVNLNFSYGKIGASEGLTNPNGNYASAGTTGMMFASNLKFGLQNSYSQVYGLLGFTWARMDVPYDILPFGDSTTLGDLATCTVFAQGSTLLENITALDNLNGIPINTLANVIQNACSKFGVESSTTNTYFINIGAGFEVMLTKSLNLFTEAVHLMQINRNKDHTFNYTANGVSGEFKGKIRTTNTTYVRAGFRYYFG